MERQREILLLILNHETLENNVSINTRNTRPGTNGPRITMGFGRILHAEGVLVVGRCNQAELIGTQQIAGKGWAGDQFQRATENLVGLLGSEVSGQLRYRCIYLTTLTSNRAYRDGYYVIIYILCEYPTRQEARDSSFCVCGKER